MEKILIVVDVQNGFTEHESTKALPEKIEALLKRGIFDAVVATRFLNADNSIYERTFEWNRMKTNADRTVPPGVAKYVNCYVDKYTYNCVNSNFIQLLCNLNLGKYPDTVYLVGVDTDCCVLTIAASLFECNIRPVVLTQYVASNGGAESHNAGLLAMKRLIGSSQLVDTDPITKNELDNF